MRPRDRADDRQAQAGAPSGAPLVGPREALERARREGLGKAGALVGDSRAPRARRSASRRAGWPRGRAAGRCRRGCPSACSIRRGSSSASAPAGASAAIERPSASARGAKRPRTRSSSSSRRTRSRLTGSRPWSDRAITSRSSASRVSRSTSSAAEASAARSSSGERPGLPASSSSARRIASGVRSSWLGVGDEDALALQRGLDPVEHLVQRRGEPVDLVVGSRAGAGARRCAPG